MIDEFHFRKYDERNYNCLHFTSEVWLKLTGQDINERLQDVLCQTGERVVSNRLFAGFKKLQKPIDPCLCLMFRSRFSPHIGIYKARKILHITKRGVEFLPVEIASRGFTQVRFYL